MLAHSFSQRKQVLVACIFLATSIAAWTDIVSAPDAVPAATATETATATQKARAEAVVQIWLWGGPSHLDTFDPKPAAGNDYTGSLNDDIPTNVPGIRIGKLLPELAKIADKYTIIRGMTHGDNNHETAAYMVQTGHPSGERVVYPSMGAVVSLFKGYDAGYKGALPPYIVITQPQGRFSEAGFLGQRFKPFATGGDPTRPIFAVEGIIAENLTAEQIEKRGELLGKLDTFSKTLPANASIIEYKKAGEDASRTISEAGEVFQASKETDETRDRYGRNRFGQSCLVARRLIEAGVKHVTINYGGWDTHKEHFQSMNRMLPDLDKGLAALISDLDQLKLLDKTIVYCGGEFGRTPKIDWQAPWNGGRGHYSKAFSVLVAGGGFKGGQVIGKTDDKGENVIERPVYPWDLLASFYTLLGIDPYAPYPNTGEDTAFIIPKPDANTKTGGILHEIMQ